MLTLMAPVSADVVVIVSRESLIESLTRTELTDVFLGRITHFPNGERLVPLDQAEASPAHDSFYREYLDKSPAQIKAHWTKLIFTGRGQPPRSATNDDEVIDVVATNPGTIGYIDSGNVDERVRVILIE
ncbi:MAG: phosphate ABC transporter substrate-binding protein [Proteobacteria bacterium]|nr:MAG: phosphate ABC transporter substrate-binding protein [Pseudomonadota bacterium]